MSNIGGCSRFLGGGRFNPGNSALSPDELQEIRSNFGHCALCSDLRLLLVGPLGEVLGSEVAIGYWVARDDRERRYALRHSVSRILEQSRRGEGRANLLRGPISSCVHGELRLAGHEMVGPGVWLAVGDTATRVSGFHWSARPCIATVVGD